MTSRQLILESTVLALLILACVGCDKPTMESLARGGRLADFKPVPTDKQLFMPRTYLPAHEALAAAHKLTGLKYAVIPADFEGFDGAYGGAGAVGPFLMGHSVTLGKLLDQVADATQTRLVFINGVAVFEGGSRFRLDKFDNLKDASLAYSIDKSVTKTPLGHVASLIESCRVDAIVPLSKMVLHKDERIGWLALRGLSEMEGDFIRNAWPGRVSIFEVLADQLDQQALLWALEEAGPAGGDSWNQAASILARARCPVLSRNTWAHAFEKTPGAMFMSMWAIGRVADPAAGWAIRSRPARTFTNWPEDQYLAAASLAQVATWRLTDHAKSKDVETRRAAVYGAGFAPADSKTAIGIIERGLADEDATVRFLACQSAALGGTKLIEKLIALASDGKSPVADRCAALSALECGGLDAALQRQSRQLQAESLRLIDPALAAMFKCAGDSSPAVRAAAARALGERRDRLVRDKLKEMLTDPDTQVLAEAARSLARFGDDEPVAVVGELLLKPDTPGDVKIAACIGLGQSRVPWAAKPLSKVATDPNQPVRLRRYAIRALAMLADQAGAKTLAELVDFNHPAHDYEAVRYLTMPTEKETAGLIIPILTAGDRSDAASAACRLADLGYGPGVRELLEGGDVFDNSTRVMHTWGAIRSRGADATAAIVEAAASPRANIRRSAAAALGSRSDPMAVDALISLTSDDEPRVRRLAVQSLALTGDPAAVPVLVSLARSDPDMAVSDAAIRALRRVEWAGREEVKAMFAELAGSERDCGIPDPKAPSLRNQPGHSFVLRKWPIGYDDLSITNITYESSLTYDSDKGLVVQWGSHGRRADFPQTGQTWFYNAASNDWTRLTDSRHWPNGVCLTWGTTYDPSSRSVVSPHSGHGNHGWINAMRANLAHSVPWVLDTTTNQWRPARPTRSTGYPLGQVNGVFDTEHDVTMFHHGPIWVYDAYENRFDKLSVKDRPEFGDADGWDPATARLISLAPGVPHMKTFAFDPAANAWTDLKAAGGPTSLKSRLMYDSTNDVMIGFADAPHKGMQVWIYHLRANKWEQLPLVHPSPRFGSIDCTYDSRNNVVVFSGGWASGYSGEVTQRETWTYRYKPADANAASRPVPGKLDAKLLTINDQGGMSITWPSVKGANSYRLLRGVGDRPWEAKLEPMNNENFPAGSGNVERKDSIPRDGKAILFRVEALNDKGEIIARSNLLRTRPAVVTDVAAIRTASGVKLAWSASPSEDVVGYRVYRAPVALRDPWSKAWDSNGLEVALISGDEPIAGTTFIDTRPITQQPTTAPDTRISMKVNDTRMGKSYEMIDGMSSQVENPRHPGELHWPATAAYVVRPVNRWGIEGGDSPATLAIPDAPGPVRVLPWADGKRLVIWPAAESCAPSGYHVMRMDDWIGTSVYRYNGGSIGSVGFVDDESFPTSDRRRYYVIGVDESGTLGVPSSGAWSHGFP